VSQQKNLAKLGINSKDPVAQQLGQTQNANNRALISGLNDLGAGAADDRSAARDDHGALHGANAGAGHHRRPVRPGARQRRPQCDRSTTYAFTKRAGDLLHDANVESFLTPDIRNKLNGFASGQIPLNVEIAEQFKTGIGACSATAPTATCGTRSAWCARRWTKRRCSARARRRAVRRQPDDRARRPGLAARRRQPRPGSARRLRPARARTAKWMQTVESTPALQAVRDGVEPDKFVQQFIVGSGNGASVMGVAQLKNQIKGIPDAMTRCASRSAGT
jgi:hypothetical protein